MSISRESDTPQKKDPTVETPHRPAEYSAGKKTRAQESLHMHLENSCFRLRNGRAADETQADDFADPCVETIGLIRHMSASQAPTLEKEQTNQVTQYIHTSVTLCSSCYL
jgi:hypothetical protein